MGHGHGVVGGELNFNLYRNAFFIPVTKVLLVWCV